MILVTEKCRCARPYQVAALRPNILDTSLRYSSVYSHQYRSLLSPYDSMRVLLLRETMSSMTGWWLHHFLDRQLQVVLLLVSPGKNTRNDNKADQHRRCQERGCWVPCRVSRRNESRGCHNPLQIPPRILGVVLCDSQPIEARHLHSVQAPIPVTSCISCALHYCWNHGLHSHRMSHRGLCWV